VGDSTLRIVSKTSFFHYFPCNDAFYISIKYRIFIIYCGGVRLFNPSRFDSWIFLACVGCGMVIVTVMIEEVLLDSPFLQRA